MTNRLSKPILYITLALLLVGSSSYGREKSHYKCAYQFDFLSDTVSMGYFRQEIYIVQIGDKLTKGFTYQRFYLDSLKKQSPDLFRTLFNTTLEKAMGEMRRTGDASYMNNNSFHPGYFQSDLYKDYKKKEIRVRDNISIQSFTYKDELTPQDWEILGDTTTILGYYCQKAQCHWRGRDWEAWFTTEIPLSEGPWKFYGLPGLITKLHDTAKHYSFELIGFQEIEEPIDTQIPKDSRKIGRIEFIETSFGKKGEMMAKTNLAKIGIVNSEPQKLNYDYIERDYK